MAALAFMLIQFGKILLRKGIFPIHPMSTKLLRLKNIGYEIDALPKIPPIMSLIEEQGVKPEEMYKTFNMGIGFCLISPQSEVKKIRKIFRKYKISTYEIGHINKKKGVFVNSLKLE